MNSKSIFGLMVAAGALILVTSPAAGAENPEARPLALRNIIPEMRSNLQVITGVIFPEGQWGLAGRTALLITDHPQSVRIEKRAFLNFSAPTPADAKTTTSKSTRLRRNGLKPPHAATDAGRDRYVRENTNPLP